MSLLHHHNPSAGQGQGPKLRKSSFFSLYLPVLPSFLLAFREWLLGPETGCLYEVETEIPESYFSGHGGWAL